VPPTHDTSTQLFEKHRGALIDSASAIVGRSMAEDVVHEAWLKAADVVHAAHNPAAYLFRVVRNLAIDIVRRSGREVSGLAGETILQAALDDRADPEQQIAERDDLRLVLRALDDLPVTTRRAFSLHRFDGLTYTEIARTLHISQGQAHKLVHAALAHCIARLLDTTASDREDSVRNFV
jgi:RNA polymerase sigma factor (sigma-70 family)